MTTYLLDTNVFIEAKNRHYGFDFCPAFWDWVDVANKNEIVFSIEQVENEIHNYAGEDELTEWAKKRRRFFLPTDRAEPKLSASFRKVSTWANSGQYSQRAQDEFLSVADFYLVVHALVYDRTVVTHEIPDAKANKNRIKIPDACKEFEVTCVTPFQMLKAEEARFVLEPSSTPPAVAPLQPKAAQTRFVLEPD